MSQSSSRDQPSAPMLINLPPPPSNPDTPTEMPGTPTSTTTSLSAISTIAIKDGHRGHGPGFGNLRGHHHNPSSASSLEAERADRISRLTGLERVSTTRQQPPPGNNYNYNSGSPLTNPANQFGGGGVGGGGANAPAYFDSNGQPTAANKMSTVGTASATGSVGARTFTEGGEADEDGMSTDTNYRTMDVDSTDPMDEDLTNRSVGGEGYEDREDREDRMSDDGTASLVGFGEGANSTMSGPIYHRRPLPGTAGATGAWGLERSSSNLSESATMARNTRERERLELAAGAGSGVGAGPDTPVSANAAAERRDAKYVDGVAIDGGGHVGTTDDDMFVDTTTRGPIPVQPGQPQTSALREGVGGPATREAAERIVRERLDGGENRVTTNASALGSPKGGEKLGLGRFYFEDKK